MSQDFQWAHSYQTNVGIERQVGRSLSVGASYVGSFNRDLPFARDVNYPVLNATATNAGANILARRPNPAFGAVLLIDSDQTSSYNGLQITAASRPWHHVSFNGFYTLSKTMTSAQLQNNTTQGLAQNYSNLAEEYGRADTDQRHVFNLSANWDIDYYRRRERRRRAMWSTGGACRRSSSCAAACRSPSPTTTSTPTSMASPPTIARS